MATNSELVNAAVAIGAESLSQKTDVLQDIASQMGADSITIDIPGYGSIDIGDVGGVVIFQEFLQKLANVIEEAGQTLGLSDKEIKEIKQMLGVA